MLIGRRLAPVNMVSSIESCLASSRFTTAVSPKEAEALVNGAGVFSAPERSRHLFFIPKHFLFHAARSRQTPTAMSMKKEDKRALIFRTIILLVIIFIVGSIAAIRLSEEGSAPSATAVRALADCLTQKGVKMYGSYWCSHCQRQKKMFGDAADKVPYVECGIQGDPRAQTKECTDAGITGYPTWILLNGERQSGAMTLSDLAARSGCPFEEPPAS